MTMTSRRLLSCDYWLLGLIGACVFGMGAELLWPHRLAPPGKSPPDDSSAETTLDSPHQEPPRLPLQAYDAIVERPLFAADRRPYEPPAEPVETPRPEAPQPHVEFQLSAVVSTPSEQIALIKTNLFPDVQRVALNESLQGWMLVEVRADSAILRRGNEQVTIELRPNAPPPGNAERPPNVLGRK